MASSICLCHISEIDRDEGLSLAETFEAGQTVRCRILRVDWHESRIGLSMHSIEQDGATEEAAAAEADPALQTQQPWQAAWEQDYAWFGEVITNHYQGDDSALRVVMDGLLALSEGQDVKTVEASARTFVFNERHPTLGTAYRDCIYQPMVELLRYLEANAFSNIIVSGGGRDFMRGFTQDLYGVPRERVIGSTVAYRYVPDERGGAIVQRADPG